MFLQTLKLFLKSTLEKDTTRLFSFPWTNDKYILKGNQKLIHPKKKIGNQKPLAVVCLSVALLTIQFKYSVESLYYLVSMPGELTSVKLFSKPIFWLKIFSKPIANCMCIFYIYIFLVNVYILYIIYEK